MEIKKRKHGHGTAATKPRCKFSQATPRQAWATERTRLGTRLISFLHETEEFFCIKRMIRKSGLPIENGYAAVGPASGAGFKTCLRYSKLISRRYVERRPGRPAFGSKHPGHVLLMTKAADERNLRN